MQIGLKVVTYSSLRHTACRSIPRPDNAHCRPLLAAGRGRGLGFPPCSHSGNFEIQAKEGKLRNGVVPIGSKQGIEREEKGIESSNGRREEQSKGGEVYAKATKEVRGFAREDSPSSIPTGRSF
jgi:hypothetical protein